MGIQMIKTRYIGRLFLTGILWGISVWAWAQPDASLRQELANRIKNCRAQVGVALVVDGKDTLTLFNEVPYPLMSVYKLHQAMAVGKYLHERGRTSESRIAIGKEDLKPDTYSPLRDKYPDGNVSLSVRELLEYTLQWSDNNACDILFAHTGGTAGTDRYIRSLGLKEFAISSTEDEMHRDLDKCYDNWSSPLEMARLLEILFTTDLEMGEFQPLIRQILMTCRTGLNRLPKPLESNGAQIAHKTGTGDKNAAGALIGINDAGMVFLPDGRRYTLVVFVKDSWESMEKTEQLIADVSEIVYRYVTGK
ncbi:class A beta-lactamase [Phocaeicola barnesiae]|uniref:class A beta-lactamase n=1 Tax=Phocaeicola barnesiae TaxID=376804 RepID=UPI00037C980F|nr:class A beta-lactamase [Phocaeicola barnesiae]